MDAYHPAYRRDSCVTCATSSVLSATGLTTVAHADDCPLGFASRPHDRFAFIEDDGAAGSISKHHSRPTPSEATRECGQGEEKRSLATAFPRSPAWNRVGLLALRLHLKPMSRYSGVKEFRRLPTRFQKRCPAQPDFGRNAWETGSFSAEAGGAALDSRNLVLHVGAIRPQIQWSTRPSKNLRGIGKHGSTFCPFMPPVLTTLERLAAARQWKYRASRDTMAEPAAWSVIALAAHGETDAALAPADWLAKVQQADGSVGISAAETDPRWPTSLAMLAWSVLDRATGARRFSDHVERAANWSLEDRGKSTQQSPKIGHDPSIVGWSWAANTASWLEPTCYQVLALTAARRGDHPRVLEGVRLISDRLLPDGGANYGNTIVLGQQLVAHIAPSGVALTALAQSVVTDDRIAGTLRYLQKNVGEATTPISLAWGVIGLTAHGWRPLFADDWIDAALQNEAWGPLAQYEHALLLLAAKPQIICPSPLPA
jgi:hypothetical protein